MQSQTVRQQIMDLLLQAAHTVREISQELRISEKEVYKHLPYVGRSVAAKGKKLMMVPPPRCPNCGYTFRDRKRYTKPSRCPRCRGEHIEQPRYQIS